MWPQEGSTIRVNDLLETGYGGLRAGTVPTVLSEARSKVTPAGRQGTMNPSDGSPVTGHTKCEMDRDAMRPESLASHFVNDLFPAAQGVVDSAAVSHCMRYAIELARLNVIVTLTGGTQASTREAVMARLSSTARSWRRRCAAQIDLLGICSMTGALESRNGQYSTGNPAAACPFSLQSPGTFRTPRAYMTPACLVYVHRTQSRPASVHDPCQALDCSSSSPRVLSVENDIIGNQQTLLRFNPLAMVDPLEVRGIWAPVAPEGLDQAEHDAFLAGTAIARDGGDLPGRIADASLFRRALLDEEGGGVGSPNAGPNLGPNIGQPLKSATEAPYPLGNTRHCDMMHDWWPEHFEYPVAYHPTAPCSRVESSFRTFDRSFRYDEAAHAMVYEPLAMRDAAHVHTHLGAEGLCRSSNLALEMQEVNTARVCTRIPADGWSADPSVPPKATPGGGAAYLDEACAPSSRDVPWIADPDRLGEPGWRSTASVGGVPFYVRGATPSYPPPIAEGGLQVGHPGVSPGGCRGVGLPPPCLSDSDCHALYRCHPVGQICVRRNEAGCSGQACLCYTHGDCQGGEMCSGTGRCVRPVIEVRNELQGDDAEFRVHTTACPGDSYAADTRGASPWGRVPDILESHGLCSHRSWWEYNATMLSRGGACTADVCSFNVDEYPNAWAFTDRTQAGGAGFRGQRVLLQEPHTCDMDYMHASGMLSCHGEPSVTYWKPLDGAQQVVAPDSSDTAGTYLRLGRSVRPYGAGGGTARIGRMLHLSDNRFGFLGREPMQQPGDRSFTEWGFRRCNTVEQCPPQDFYVYGHVVPARRVRLPGGQESQVRPPGDTYRCGSFGRFVASTGLCNLDLAIAPLYRALCLGPGVSAQCSTTLQDGLPTRCAAFLPGSGTCCGLAYTFHATSTAQSPAWAPDQEPIRLGMPCLINRLASESFLPVRRFDSSASQRATAGSYLDAMRCASAVVAAAEQQTSGVPVYGAGEAGRDAGPTMPTRALYHLSQYSVYEYPMSWLVRCGILVGRFPSDGSVPCAEWSEAFDVEDAASTSFAQQGLQTWRFLTRIRGGILREESIPAAAARWRQLVAQASEPGRVSQYLDTDPATGRPIRECAAQRSVIRAHFDDSTRMRDQLAAAKAAPGGATKRWPILNGLYMSDDLGSFVCSNTFGECNNPANTCPCTYASLLERAPTSQAESPTSVGAAYLTSSAQDADLVEAYDFLSASASPIDPVSMRVPVQRFARPSLDASGRVRVDAAAVRAILTGLQVGLDGLESGPGLCSNVDLQNPAYDSKRSCISGVSGDDASVAAFEASFWGDTLEESRRRPAYMMVLMGTDTEDDLWGAIENDEAYVMYNNPQSLADRVQTGGYYIEGGQRNAYFGQDTASVPNMGLMLFDLSNTNIVGPAAVYRNYNSPVGSSSSEGFGVAGMSSFCGLRRAGFLSRTDGCGPEIGRRLVDCPQPAVGLSPKTYSRQDRNLGQTCIHDHSCTLHMMGGPLRDRYLEPGSARRFVHAPGWSLRDHPNARFRWPDSSSQAPPNGRLPIDELWRHHSNPSSRNIFLLPLGVHLQAFNTRDVNTNDLRDPYNMGKMPRQDEGMWTMCPHSPGDTGASTVSQAKSRLLDGNAAYFGTGNTYQSNVVPSGTCPASDVGIGRCVLGGFRSYRVGTAPGYTMDVGECGALQAPVMVQRDIYRCVECEWFQPVYCEGRHECMFKADPLRHAAWDRARFVPQSIREAVKTGDLSVMDGYDAGTGRNVLRRGLSYELATMASVALLANEALSLNGGSDLFYQSVVRTPLEASEGSAWSRENPFQGFNAGVNQVFEKILPDLPPGAGVRCTEVDGSQINYGECGFVDNYDAFVQSVGRNMMFDEGLVVRPRTRAAYQTSKEHMLAVGIPAWSNATRDPGQTFVQSIMDRQLQCSRSSFEESVCARAAVGSGYKPMSPWLGGSFNVLEASQDGSNGGCDTTMGGGEPRIEGGTCTVKEVCGDGTGFKESIADVCFQNRGRVSTLETVPRSSDHNLCSIMPPTLPPTCTHAQGMLYGLQGVGVKDLFSGRDLGPSPPGASGGGLYGNPMFQGYSTPQTSYGRVSIDTNDIAGHHIVYAIQEPGRLVVRATPLTPHTPGDWTASFDQSDNENRWDWLANLPVSREADLPSLRHMMPSGGGAGGWECPLWQVRMWSGQAAAEGLLPWVPNPLRTARLYGGIMTPYTASEDIAASHPTTSATPIDADVRLHTSYWTTNGFCIYLGGGAPHPSSEECSLYSLARSVLGAGGSYHNYTTVFASACLEQVDWPFHPIFGRDGSFTPSPPVQQRCAVLDRLPRFQYRVKTDAPFSRGSHTTTQAPGVCHMGRAAVLSGPLPDPGCWRTSETQSGVGMRCPGQPLASLPKRPIRTPHEMAASGMRSRQRCDSCDAAPAFRAPGGGPMPVAEVGYGRPFRWEMARTLAGDLRFLLCGNATSCPHLQASEWTLTDFLQRYFRDPRMLVNGSAAAGGDNASDPPTLEGIIQAREAGRDANNPTEYERRMWEDVPWVVCKKGGKNCTGTIRREDWVADRGGQCSARILEHLAENPGDLAVELDLCNLNSQMDALCKLIAQSRLEVAGTNCIASGEEACMPRGYFYTPSTFSSSNQQFVRDTVRQFYRRFSPSIGGAPASRDAVCPAESDQARQLLDQNSRRRQACGSVALEPMKQGLETVRSLMDTVMKIILDGINIVLYAMQLMGPALSAASKASINKSVMYWFVQLITDMMEVIKVAGTLFFRMIFEYSPLGMVLKEALKIICTVVDWLVNEIWKGFMCPIIEAVLPPLINIFISVLEGLQVFLAAFGAGGGIQGLIDGAKDFKADVEGGALQCGKKVEITCFEGTDYLLENPALPVSTRCWAGYQPSPGDPSPLSCTRADTCFNPATSERVVCDQCPLMQAEDFLSFACSSLTKRCECGVQRQDRTRCTSHEQCYSAVAGAACMATGSDIFSTSFSTVPCQDCNTQQICVTSSANTPGYCACPFRDVEVEPCTDVGSLVTPDPTAMCSVMLNNQILSTQSTYIGWKDLSITSCALLDPAGTFCYRVDSSGGVQRSHASSSVVGFSMLATGRRRRALLSTEGLEADQQHDEEAAVAHGLLTEADWHGTGLCADLVHAYRASPAGWDSEGRSVVDRHALKDCIFLRLITNRTIEAYNWTSTRGFEDTALLTWAGVARALSSPTVVGRVLANPGSAVFFLSRTDWAGPVLSSVLPAAAALLDPLIRGKQANGSSTNRSVTPPLFLDFVHGAFPHAQSAQPPPRPSNLSSSSMDALGLILARGAAERPHHPRGRSLLQAESWKDNLGQIPATESIAAIQAYSALIAGAGQENPALKEGYFWLSKATSVGGWSSSGNGRCQAAERVANVLSRSFSALGRQVSDPPPVQAFERQRVVNTIPRLYNYTGNLSGPRLETAGSGSLPQVFIRAVSGLLPADTVRSLIGFVTGPPDSDPSTDGATASQVLFDLFTCDFQGVLDCQKKRANTFVGSISVVLLFLGGYMALGSAASLVIGGISMPLTVLWFVYGYSPACVPMVPDCAVKDLLGTLRWLVPVQFSWPDALQRSPGCALDPGFPHEDCFLPCSTEPLGYTGWEPSVAWAACDWDPSWCSESLLPWARDAGLTTLAQRIASKFAVIDTGTPGTPAAALVEAERFCFSVTIFNVTPYVLLILLAVYSSVGLVGLPFIAAQWLLDTLFQTLAYVHMVPPRGGGGGGTGGQGRI